MTRSQATHNKERKMTITKNEHGRWEVRIKTAEGKIKSFSTGKTNRKEAEKIIKDAKLRELEHAAELGVLTQNVIAVLVGGKRTSVADAIDPWLESMTANHRSPNYVLNTGTWIRAWAKEMQLERRQITSIETKDIDQWVNPPCSSKTTLGTRRVMLSAVRNFLTFCGHKGWIQGNPANLVSIDYDSLLHSQKEPLAKSAFTDKEVEWLLQRTSPNGGLAPSVFWHAAVALSRCLGLRLGDICRLEWSSLARGVITVWTSKRDKRVQPTVVHPEWLKGALEFLTPNDSAYIFPEQRAISRDPAIRSTLSTQFSRILDGLGIRCKSFHCLRASYVTERELAGVALEEIAIDVGHSDVETTKGYVRSSGAFEVERDGLGSD